MKRLFIIALSFSILIIYLNFSFAEIIVLKSGKKVEADILEKTDEYIKVDFYGVESIYLLEDIQEIKTEANAGSKNSGKARIVENSRFIIYIPKDIDYSRKYPLIVALHPGANAEDMLRIWSKHCDQYKLILFASKESRNGIDMDKLISMLVDRLNWIINNYPVDEKKVIATGLSGGGMTSHAFSYMYPELISAIIVNTGMMHEYYQEKGQAYEYPRDKIAVFLASPTDFRYNEMKRDLRFLLGLGWKTKWVEFTGGHRLAPIQSYAEALEWLSLELNF